MLTQTLRWAFPLPEPACGINLGNGTLGLMVWGVDSLIITFGRNGFWDRRRGSNFIADTTYAKFKGLLDAEDFDGLNEIISCGQSGESQSFNKPTQLPGGRIELSFCDGWKPQSAELDLASGCLMVRLRKGGDGEARVLVRTAMDAELAVLECQGTGKVHVRVRPAWEFLSEILSPDGVRPPTPRESDELGGFFQPLPADPGLGFAWAWRSEGVLALATSLGQSDDAARRLAENGDLSALMKASERWWADFWAAVPKLSIPDEELSDAYYYGLVKLAGLTAPGGVAATLVGPFMDDDTMPGWNNDYHFNINAQMIYWPVLAANRPDHLNPLWAMMKSWLPEVTEASSRFFGVEGGVMLPHACDDVCRQAPAGSWSGFCFDIGCTAWMGQLAWLHYRHTLDESVLRDIAWPLLSGAFVCFYATSERAADGRLSLPLSVSPEYGFRGESHGKDSSFSLAAFHLLAAILPQAARVLGLPEDARWKEVTEHLPPYSTVEGPDVWNDQQQARRLAQWEGMDQRESHRHHSMFAGVYPFKTIDPFGLDAVEKKMLTDSLQHWLAKGAGLWAGWSFPWAASLCAYCGMPDGAIHWLKYGHGLYFNAGGNSDHNGDFVGNGVYARDYILEPGKRYRAVIQSDAAMGLITALLDILVQTRGDEIRVVPYLPKRWRNFSFERVLTEGAFLIGAEIRDWRVQQVRVTSVEGGRLTLRHGLGPVCIREGERYAGEVFEADLKPGESFVLTGEAQ